MRPDPSHPDPIRSPVHAHGAAPGALVSVIMPTFNSEQWVADTIDDLAAQTYPHIELIVVDDGSRDGTVSLVRRKLSTQFNHARQIIELGTSHGPSVARNVGLHHASGAWIQYLDSDDFMHAMKLEQQMAHCLQAPTDVAAVYSPWQLCFFDGNKVTSEAPVAVPDMTGKHPVMCLVGNRPLLTAGLARRSVLDQIGGFDETLRFWETEELNVRIAKAGRLEAVPFDGAAYYWRMHRGKYYIGGDQARYHVVPVALSWIELMLKTADFGTIDDLSLPPKARKEILEDCTKWARLLYKWDRSAFRSFIAQARRLVPDLAPVSPRFASVISRCIGYEGAEAVATMARTPKAVVRRALRALDLRPESSIYDLT